MTHEGISLVCEMYTVKTYLGLFVAVLHLRMETCFFSTVPRTEEAGAYPAQIGHQ